jgi:hypothetical protein
MGGRGLAGVGFRLSSFCCTRATRMIFLKYHAKNERVTESRIKIKKKQKKYFHDNNNETRDKNIISKNEQ